MGDPSRARGAALTVAPPARASGPGRGAGRLADLRAGLFDAAPGRGIGWRQVLGAALMVSVGTALGLLRQPGVGALDTVWAEDGQVFLAEAARDGPLSALATSYAGYVHAVPRLLGAVAAAVPAPAAAEVLAVGAALGAALVALLVYVASAGHLSSPLSRLLVSAVVVVPVGQDEILNSIANWHWYGLYALFWVLLWTPRSRAGRVVAGLTVLLVAASDILVVVFLPLALLRGLRRRDGGQRDRLGLALAGTLTAGLAVQVAGVLVGSGSRALAPDPVGAVAGYVLRAVPAPLMGQRWLGPDLDARWLILAGLAWLVVGATLLTAGRGGGRPAWPLALAAALHSVALYVLPVLLTGAAAPRYAVAPAMLVVTALVALLQPAPGSAAGLRGLPAATPLYGLALLLTIVGAVNLRVDNARAHGPGWDGGVDTARASCAAGAATARVPLAPRNGERVWVAELPCAYLQR